MNSTVRKPTTLAARFLPRLVLAALVALLLATSVADAALTTGACLAQKRVAWSTLRKCQGTEEAKQLKGKPADLAQCLTKLQTALAKITAKATKAVIPCRYGDHGDNTLTDYDTGLMWEIKSLTTVAYKDSWSGVMSEFVEACNGNSTDGQSLAFGCAIFHDWRVPTILELQTIVDKSVPGCRTVSPCIDPIFGPTVADFYWSASTFATFPGFAWGVVFSNGFANIGFKGNASYVRAVRAGL